MRARFLVAGGLLAVLVLVTTVWLTGTSIRQGSSIPGTSRATPSEPPPELVGMRTSERAHEQPPSPGAPPGELPAPVVAMADVVPGERPLGHLEVVVREADGSPAPGAKLELAAFAGPSPSELAFEDERGWFRASAVSDAAGAATFADVPAGPYSVRAEGPEKRQVSKVISHSTLSGADPISLVLPAQASFFQVRVVDGRGSAVPGARVELACAVTGATIQFTSTADEHGIARFENLQPLAVLVTAAAEEGRTGMARLAMTGPIEAAMRRGGLEVVIGPPGTLEGALEGLDPAALAEAHVVAHALTSDAPHYRTYGTSRETPVVAGRYRFEGLAVGKWTLALRDPGAARLVLPRMKWGDPELANSVDPLEVSVVAGRTTLQDLAVAPGGTLAGRVRRPDGSPIANARIRVTYTPRTSNFPDGFYLREVNVWRYDSDALVEGKLKHPVTHPGTSTDADGRYRLTGLFPGVQRVEVFAADLAYDRREEVDVRDGAVTELEHVLAAAGAIQGVDPERGYLGVTRVGEERARMIAILPASGSFAFSGLEAGVYQLAKFHSDASIEPVPLATVEVQAGRTTWVDLSQIRRPVVIRGRVVGESGPLAGARVQLYPEKLVTDEEGRFETTRSFSGAGQVTVEHSGVVTMFQVPPMSRGETRADWELVLGNVCVRLVVLDAAGGSATARVDLWGDLASSAPGIAGVRAKDLTIDGSGTIRELAPGDYRVTARFPDGAETSVSVRLPSSDEIVLRAPLTGDLELVLTLPDGRPAADWHVQVHAWTGAGSAPEDLEAFFEHAAYKDTRTDIEGRASVRVQAGALVIVPSENDWGEAMSRPERLNLLAGERRELALTVEDARRR